MLIFSSDVFTKQLPETKFKVKRRILPFRIGYATGLYVQWPRFNASLIQRSLHYRWNTSGERPIHVANYFNVGNWLNITIMALFGVFFYVMSLFKYSRHLLDQYPSLLTFGLVQSTPETSKLTPMLDTYVVKGWGNPRRRHPDDEPGGLDPPEDSLVLRLKAPDPGYLSSAICLVQCAYTLLEESYKIPDKGGALTPGVAFGATRVYDRLRQRGLSMDIVQKQS